MQKTELSGKFWKFALPSMLGQLLNSLFIIVDGFFVGQNLGDKGLAAINIIWPMVAFIQAVSIAIGTGGAVQMSIGMGRGERKSALKARGHAVVMLIATTLITGIGFFVLYPILLPLLGARGDLYPMAEEYIRVVCIFAICQVSTIGIMPLLRGAGRAMTVMCLTIGGLFGNIFLDWLFIEHFQWGMQGAAFATVLSQGACGISGFILLITHKEWRLTLEEFQLEIKRMLRILLYGFSSFGLTISVSLLILFNNLQALHYGGTAGVAVYAVFSYVLGSVLPLVSGIGDGIQPLLGNAYGAQDFRSIGILRRKGMSLAIGTAIVSSILIWLFRRELPIIFGASEVTVEEASGAMWTLVLAFPFMAVVRFCCSYFSAQAIPGKSSALAYGEPLVAQPLFLIVLPLIWGLEGVWMAYPAAMITMTIVALYLLFHHKKGEEQKEKISKDKCVKSF